MDLAGGSRERRIKGHVAQSTTLLSTAVEPCSRPLAHQPRAALNGKDGAALRTLKANTVLYSVSILPDGAQVAVGDGMALPSSGTQRLVGISLTLAAFRDARNDAVAGLCP